MGQPDVVRRCADVATMYAQRGAERQHRRYGRFVPNTFYPITIVCGTEDALKEHTHRMNGDVPARYKGCSILDTGRDDMLMELLDQMNPKGVHKDGAISFRADDGTVHEVGVYIDAPHRAAAAEMDYIREVTGELGTRHIATLDASICQGIEATAVVGQTVGEAMTFDEGLVLRDRLWVPGRYAEKQQHVATPDNSPGYFMRALRAIGLCAAPEQQLWHQVAGHD